MKMAEKDFTDADKIRIDKGWYISTLKEKIGDLVYFREIWQTGNSWVVETSSGEVFLGKYEVRDYTRVKNITTYLEKRRSNLNWAENKQKQLEGLVQSP